MKIIIGQEAICPDGLGRVIACQIEAPTNNYIQVSTYVKDRGCKWAPHNVTLIDPVSKRETIPDNGGVFQSTGEVHPERAGHQYIYDADGNEFKEVE